MPDIKTVLVAEDDLKLLRAVTIRLEAAGYRVIAVQDGYQALDKCRKLHPDVLLLDVNMPAGNGLSVQERINHSGDIGTVPVIYMTGDTSENTMHKAEDLGAFAVIHKPLDTRTLLNVVSYALARGKHADMEAA